VQTRGNVNDQRGRTFCSQRVRMERSSDAVARVMMRGRSEPVPKQDGNRNGSKEAGKERFMYIGIGALILVIIILIILF
jgi:hypothetical protein